MLHLSPLLILSPSPPYLDPCRSSKVNLPLDESQSRVKTGEDSVAAAAAAVSQETSGATQEPQEAKQESHGLNGDLPRQTPEPLTCTTDPDSSIAASEVTPEGLIGPDNSGVQHTSGIGEDSLVGDSKVDLAAVEAVAQASAASVQHAMQPQVDALWDAVKWMEDRMEAIDTERRGELEEASRTAAQNTAKVKAILSASCVLLIFYHNHADC